LLGSAGDAAARALRAELGIGDAPIPDLRTLIRNREDLVLVERSLSGELDGAYAYDDHIRRGFIYLNAKPIWTRRRFTMAHELGHHTLAHRQRVDQNVFELNGDPSEIEANAFAAELLMPASGLRTAPRVHEASDVAELAAYYLVSGRAMVVRLHALRIIDSPFRRHLEETYDPKFYASFLDSDPPDRRDVSRTSLPQQFVDAVITLYTSGAITFDAAREALDISPNEAQEMLPAVSDDEDLLRRANSGVSVEDGV